MYLQILMRILSDHSQFEFVLANLLSIQQRSLYVLLLQPLLIRYLIRSILLQSYFFMFSSSLSFFFIHLSLNNPLATCHCAIFQRPTIFSIDQTVPTIRDYHMSFRYHEFSIF